MAEITFTGSTLGTPLQQILMADDIQPGSDPSYQLCKLIYSFHPLGGKMVDIPIRLAMSQKREISIKKGPEERIREAFESEWESIGADTYIANTARLSRIYGAASLVFGAKGVPTDRPIKPMDLPGLDLYFNALDPLNTAGSLVLNQDPNAPDFQKPTVVTAAGQPYHPSRAVVMFHESPLYIEFTASSFGYVGRSTYQRALFPLKSFIQSLITDDMVTRKAGVIVAKMKAPGSIVDRAMTVMAGIKRNLVKEAETNNVISITPEEAIETLNMQNTDTAMTVARKNILENIAAAANMPAKMLNSESFAEGFGEGSEDAKDVVRFVEGVRGDLEPLYQFFERIVMFRAWTPEFYETIKADLPEYKNVSYTQAFFEWRNSFTASWPSLLVEPESELVKVDETKLKNVISMVEVMLPNLDPENKTTLLDWAATNFNECKNLLQHPLILNLDSLKDYVPPAPPTEPGPPSPNSDEE